MFYKLIALSTATSALISDCYKGTSLFAIQGLGFWPDPAIRNENSTISFAYTVPEPGFPGGTSTYSLTYNFIPISPSTEDLCKSVTCPIEPGTYNISTSSTFPNLNGNVAVKIEWKSPTDEKLLCAEIKTKVQ